MQTSLFGQKLLPQKLDRTPSPRRWTPVHRVGITSLPTELLLWIFNGVASASKRNPFKIIHYTKHIQDPNTCDCDQAWTIEDNPSRLTLFPYAQAKVCTRWCEVLSMQPAFWTRVIVSRNGEHTPPLVFEKYLQWSRDLPIEVYIGNARSPNEYPDEAPLIQRYTEILAPHASRCRVIDYEVRYATSLPSLVHHLPNISHLLEVLKLRSEEACDPAAVVDEGRLFEVPQGSDQMGRYRDISLRDLTLDGRNFILASRCMPGLVENVYGSITIHNSLPASEMSSSNHRSLIFLDVRSLAILPQCNELTTLVLQNIAFQSIEESGSIADELAELENLISVNLVKVGPDTLNYILGNTGLPGVQVDLEDCDFRHFNGSITDPMISLRRINLASFRAFLDRWKGANLAVYSCPDLDDNLLSLIATSNQARDSEHLTHLKIDNCSVSVDGVKDFISRTAQQTIASPYFSLEWLDVRGAYEPLSEADRSYLEVTYPYLGMEWSSTIRYQPLPASFAVDDDDFANDLLSSLPEVQEFPFAGPIDESLPSVDSDFEFQEDRWDALYPNDRGSPLVLDELPQALATEVPKLIPDVLQQLPQGGTPMCIPQYRQILADNSPWMGSTENGDESNLDDWSNFARSL